jgi:dephospho-CoA kinase
MSFVVGLTGGIGSGKSTVAELFFQRSGAALVDTDAIAHTLTAPQGAAMAAIRNAFGDARAAGRRWPGPRRDAQPGFLRSYREGDTRSHPASTDPEHSEARCADATSAARTCCWWYPCWSNRAATAERADRVLVVDCDEAVQIARVMARSGLTAGEVEAIMATQASRLERRRRPTIWCSTIANSTLCCRRSTVCTANILNWPWPKLMLGVEVLLQMIQNYRKSPFPTLAAV